MINLKPQNNMTIYKTSLSQFLSHNPFPHPLTQGFFYREKMRAIYRISPAQSFQNILEVGGGKSGLTSLLYPQAKITNLDFNPDYGNAPCNQQENIKFVCGDATQLPFENESFDAITMFDVLEHISDHEKAIFEAKRVLKPNGFILVSTPNENWRFPYYKFMKNWCPEDTDMMQEWGHVRRGYTLDELKMLIDLPCQKIATFINPITVLCHDVAFSHLSPFKREALCLALSPITWLSYTFHQPTNKGTETASAWYKG